MIISMIPKFLEQGGKKTVMIWGAAGIGMKCLRTLQAAGIDVANFVDKDPGKQSVSIAGLPVISPESLFERDPKDIYIFIATINYTDEISQILREHGFKEYIDFVDYFRWYEIDKPCLPHNDFEKEKCKQVEASKAYEAFLMESFGKTSKELTVSVVGLGLHCQRLFLGKFEVKYVFDNSKKQQGRQIKGYTILPPAELKNIKKDDMVFLLWIYYEHIYERVKKQLMDYGISEDRIVHAKPLAERLYRIDSWSYSAGLADRKVLSLFASIGKDPAKIRYLDIGANHYLFYNNTYLFYNQGACGVLVEANPDLCEVLRNNRPRDIVLNCGASTNSMNGIMTYYKTTRIGRNSFLKDKIIADMQKIPDLRILEELSIPMYPVNRIIREHFADGHIDFISIDIEGMDCEVLESIDWDAVRIDVLLAELNPNSDRVSSFISWMGEKWYDYEFLADGMILFYRRDVFGNIN
ncbi:MAG: hypothetical protein GX022_07360 [Clostridiaceae bacterium]|nr:hypothetical protein [Clostridiaceae bacterium]